LIGALIVDPQAADADDEQSGANTGREWSDSVLRELGDMLRRGLSIKEIARRLKTPIANTRRICS